jgi:hypothetical protein
MNQAGKVAMFDISNPEEPRLLKALDLGRGSGPHYIALSKDEKRLGGSFSAVSNKPRVSANRSIGRSTNDRVIAIRSQRKKKGHTVMCPFTSVIFVLSS